MAKKEKMVFKTTDQIFYDESNIRGQMMRYNANKLSFNLGVLGLAFSILAAFICLNSVQWNFSVTIKILGNIAILLFGFLSIEKVKSYSLEYSYLLVGIGSVCALRIFWIPMKLITLYTRYLANPTDVEANNFLGKVVKDTRPITGDVPSTIAYLPQSGTFRGTVAMVLLVLAAVAFISAGVIGIIKAKHYHAYMSTQDTTKGV